MSTVELLYVGTAAGLAIYRVENGALRRTGQALAGHAVRAISVLLADALVAAADGLPTQQSFDGGRSWAPSTAPAPEPLGLRVAMTGGPAVLANQRLMGATAYARTGSFTLGAGAGGALLFRSYDDGIHWEPAAAPMVGRVATIVPSATRAMAAYAGAESGALLQSDDRGESWREAAREPAAILCIACVTLNEGD